MREERHRGATHDAERIAVCGRSRARLRRDHIVPARSIFDNQWLPQGTVQLLASGTQPDVRRRPYVDGEDDPDRLVCASACAAASVAIPHRTSLTRMAPLPSGEFIIRSPVRTGSATRIDSPRRLNHCSALFITLCPSRVSVNSRPTMHRAGRPDAPTGRYRKDLNTPSLALSAINGKKVLCPFAVPETRPDQA